LELLPASDPAVSSEWGLTSEETAQSAWCVAPGIRFSGAAAISLALSVAWGSSFPLVLWRLPGFGRVADAVYAWVARNRHRLP
jgi:predicted DCC family thiol-disulfide oxidoreductase YuxK